MLSRENPSGFIHPHSLEQSQYMHVWVGIFVHLPSMFPVVLAALSMLLSEAEQGLFVPERLWLHLGEGWCTLLGCQWLLLGRDTEASGSKWERGAWWG